MSIIGWIILGGLAGWAATAIMDEGRQGCLFNVVVGVVGAFLGGFLFNLIGAAGVTGFNLWSFLVALVGASVLLWIARQLRR